MDKPKLKPCPFCGGTADIWINTPKTIVVQCIRCLAATGAVNICKNHAKEHAIELWNRRVESDELRED